MEALAPMLSQVTGLLSLKPVVTGPLLAQLLLVIVPQHKEPFSLVLKKTTTVLKLSFKKEITNTEVILATRFTHHLWLSSERLVFSL